ncbi:hypothetical protein HPC49_22075 [Pyxidicoccus fallax]|uniref:Uncharacterized protein n=1 Tax=Pyxidicoccus fallax TaxID=394095 RepID=A0A848L6K5_9BACT|nr:hypothetical protein [Pyxidicoccus fallax]NMO14147.1 hypothetical protein [Pyxidicoccus fallax]NPC80900.1 hypothetical protein [Pyxidicoccus fallax]
MRQPPRNVAVLHHSDLVPGLLAHPVTLGVAEVFELVEAARREEAWAE